MEDVVRAVGACVGLPLAGMAAALWRARPSPGAPRGEPARDWMPALAGLCVPAAWVIAQGWPRVPPARAADWLVWIALAGTLAGAIGVAAAGRGFAARALAGAVTLALGAALLGAMAWPLTRREETAPLAWTWLVGSTLSIAPTRWALARVGEERRGAGAWLAAGALGLSSAVILLTGSVAAAILRASLAALMSAGALWGLAGRRTPRIGPGAGGLALPVAGLWLYAGLIGDTPWYVALPAWLASIVGGLWRPPARWSTLARGAARAMVVGVPALAAIIAALLAQPDGTW
jgi:hypothetical protein